MSENSVPWGEEWMASQRAFWDTWSCLYRQAAEPGLGGFSVPWTAALEVWQKSVSQPTLEPGQAFLQGLLREGKVFLRVVEDFTRLAGRAKGAEWQEVFQGKVNDWKAMLTGGSPADMTQAMRGLMPFFELPFETWMRTVSGFSVLPGDFLQALKPEGLRQVTDEVHDRIGRFLSVPSVGYTREWQDQNQRGAKLVLDYQRALQEYLNAHARLGLDTIERFSKRVMQRAETGQEITSLREVYDLWVDAGEAAYSEFVLTEEYAAIYGRLVNALMALKHHSQNLVDEAVGAANLPTRRGMTTLQCRQQEVRREIAALRSELGEAIGDGLNTSIRRFEETLGEALGGVDVKALSAEVQALRGDALRVADLEREIALLSADNKRLSAAVGALSANGQETTVLGKRDDAAPAAKGRRPARTPATRSRSKIT
ncbi:MAG: class III poly(R)-hydroxyalkanoic acid synthase subunit PhaE [Beggiatoa sp.]|nr:class III poly(R)-hydroxyalkanoic acid synthase subunit PhaE [Beggiatoa sp.]